MSCGLRAETSSPAWGPVLFYYQGDPDDWSDQYAFPARTWLGQRTPSSWPQTGSGTRVIGVSRATAGVAVMPPRPLPRNLAPARRTGQTEGVPDSAARHRNSKWGRYRRWLRRLTLKQYALFTAVLYFVLATAVAAVQWATIPHPRITPLLVEVPVLTVIPSAFLTWRRWRNSGKTATRNTGTR